MHKFLHPLAAFFGSESTATADNFIYYLSEVYIQRLISSLNTSLY